MPYDNNGTNIREYYRTQARMREATTRLGASATRGSPRAVRASTAAGGAAGTGRFLYVGGCPASTTGGWARPPGGWKLPTQEMAGIAAFAIGLDGSLTPSHFHPTPNGHVSWITRSPASPLLYATGGDSTGSGWLQAFRCGLDGSLEPVGEPRDTLGKAAHLEMSADGRFCLTASYGAGTLAVLPVCADGAVGETIDVRRHTMTQCNPRLADRQEACHVHQVRLDPTNRWALACDLGADLVYVYGFDPVRGMLAGTPDSPGHLKLPKGSGPRHLDWHPKAPLVYVLCELTGDLVTCAWDAASGTLSHQHSISTLPDAVTASRAHHCGGAHVLASLCGTRVYVSTRAPNAIVTFAVEAAGLRRLHAVDSTGVCPRHFHLDVEGRTPPILRVGNQDSQTIASFPVQPDGTLGEPTVTATEGVCPGVLAL